MYNKILVKEKKILFDPLHDRDRILECYFIQHFICDNFYIHSPLFHIHTQTFKTGTFKIAYKNSLNTFACPSKIQLCLYLAIHELCASITEVGLFFKSRYFRFLSSKSVYSLFYVPGNAVVHLVLLFVPYLVRILLLMDFHSTLLFCFLSW